MNYQLITAVTISVTVTIVVALFAIGAFCLNNGRRWKIRYQMPAGLHSIGEIYIIAVTRQGAMHALHQSIPGAVVLEIESQGRIRR